MTDPLTPEGREVVESIRALLNAGAKTNLMEMKMAVRLALSIIDNLSAPKQYTEAELRAQFMRDNDDLDDRIYDGGKRTGDFANYTTSRAWNAVKTMARFLRVLKEPRETQKLIDSIKRNKVKSLSRVDSFPVSCILCAKALAGVTYPSDEMQRRSCIKDT